MTKLTYKEQLLDPRWQKKRLVIFNRDNWTCLLCGDKGSTLHVHHNSYANEAWDISDDELKTLCCHCHALQEFVKYNKNMYLKCKGVFKIKRSNGVLLLWEYLDEENNIGYHLFSKFEDVEIEYVLSIGKNILNEIIQKINA